MIRPIVNLDKYSYKMSDITLLANDWDEPIVIPPIQVLSFVSLRDYEKNIIPLSLLSIHVNKDNYEKIITSINTLTATFTIYKCTYDDDNNISKYSEPLLNGTYKATNRDLMDMRIPSQLKNTANSTTNTTQNTIELSLYLYDYQSIIKYKKNFSYILNCTMNDAIFAMLKDRNFSNILMSPTTNETQNFIIPYGNLQDNLNHINEYYGIYDSPRLFFVDFDTTYFLNKGEIGSTLKKEELSTVMMYLEKSESATSVNDGSYNDIENGIYILNATPFSINDTDSLIDFYSAGKIVSLISGSSDKFEDIIGDYEIEKSILINNKKIHSQTIFNIRNNKRSMTIEFSDIDLSIITPNKKFTLIPDSFYDSNYNIKGDYRLTKSIITLSRRTEDVMKCVTQCFFNKIEK